MRPSSELGLVGGMYAFDALTDLCHNLVNTLGVNKILGSKTETEMQSAERLWLNISSESCITAGTNQV